MNITVQPSQLSGTIQAPPSKSSMQRALAAALLKKDNSFIHNPGNSEDDKAAIAVISALGAEVIREEGVLVIKSNGVDPRAEILNCGESGLAIRMFTPIAALSKKQITILGEGSLVHRPMHFFDLFFPQLGVAISSNSGKLPIQLQGPLQPRDIEVDGSLSSQFITGLIFAYSAAEANATITVKDLRSRAYIDLTLDVMKKFGLVIPENNDYRKFIFRNNPAHYSSSTVHYSVECDWSNAAFLLVAGAIAGPITVRGLDLSSTQADKAIMDALMLANAGVAIEAKGIKIHPAEMHGFSFDATDCPDLFPPLVALAAYCKGKTTLLGVTRLLHKESNRALSLQQEFTKMGVRISIEDDVMTIKEAESINGSAVHSHHDHRIAMACAVAALKATGKTFIEAAQAVNKSYADFFQDLKTLGAAVSLPER